MRRTTAERAQRRVERMRMAKRVSVIHMVPAGGEKGGGEQMIQFSANVSDFSAKVSCFSVEAST